MNRKGILFDLDGTLWDTFDITFKSINKIVKKYNLDKVSKDTVIKSFGLNKFEISKLYFPNVELDKGLKYFDESENFNIEYLKNHGGIVYSGVSDVLIKLYEKYDLFIVSNASSKKYIEAFLISSNLGKYFKDYIAASEINISKACAINKIINDYKLDWCVYIGDTLKDMEAAKLCNIPFIQAMYGFGDVCKCDYYINSINELPYIIYKNFK